MKELFDVSASYKLAEGGVEITKPSPKMVPAFTPYSCMDGSQFYKFVGNSLTLTPDDAFRLFAFLSDNLAEIHRCRESFKQKQREAMEALKSEVGL